jgi:hypothetical protein
MAKTAVGLFKSPGSVDEVVRDLKASGFPAKDVRVLGEPREMSGNGVTSTPRTDFEVDLMRELRGIGAADADAAAYVQGVRSGGVMIFATGEGEKADTAAGIMNQHFALEVEELNGSEPHLPSTNADDPAAARVGSVQVGRVRSPGAGARLFVW